MHKDDEDALFRSVLHYFLLARVAARFKARKKKKREREKNKLLKFEHIVLLSTSNFESSFREISTKGERKKEKRGGQEKRKKERKNSEASP